MEGSLGDADESPDPQGHATDWRFAVCSFKDAWDEGEPPLQMQLKDPNPLSPPVGASQGEGVQDSRLPGELQAFPGQLAADGLEEGQRGTLGGSSVQLDVAPSGVEILLCPMSSHLSLAQGENDSQEGGLAGESVSDREMPVHLDPEGSDSNPVDLGDLSSETSSELLEAGKEDWAREVLEGRGATWRWVLRLGEVSDPTQAKVQVQVGFSG